MGVDLQREVYDELGKSFALLSLPLSLVENRDFLNMIAILRKHPQISIPSRYTLKKHEANAERIVKELVIARLKGPQSFVSLAVDGWTNIRHEKLLNAIPICQGIAYYWKSIVNGLADNSAPNQYNGLQPVIKDMIDHGIYIVALVADNEAVNGTLFRLLQADYPFLVQVGCAAHTIQLCVRNILELPGVMDVIAGMSTILNSFEKNKAFRIRLKNVQLISSTSTTRKPKIYSIIKPCDTRWSSTLRTAERMILLQDGINMIIRQPDSFWNNLKSLCNFLQPFQIATDIIQRDSSTLMDVYTQFCNLLAYIDSIDSANPFFNAKAEAKDVILFYWKKFVNVNAVICCAMFSFDDSYKTLFTPTERAAAQEWFFTFGAEFLWFYEMTDLDSLHDVRLTIQMQYGEFVSRSGGFQTMDVFQKDIKDRQLKINQSVSTSASDGSSKTYSYWNPKVVWSQHFETAWELCQCVIVLLSISSSEAAVERSFSMQDQVHSKIRNKSADEQVHIEMSIKMNTKSMTTVREPSGSWVEMDELYETIFEPSLFAPLVRPPPSVDSVASVGPNPLAELVQPAQDDISLVEADGKEEEVAVEHLADSDDKYSCMNEDDDNVADMDENNLDPSLPAADSDSEEEKETEDSPSISDFVRSYVIKHNIRPNTKFNSDRTNVLLNEILLARIKVTMVDIKELIMAEARRM